MKLSLLTLAFALVAGLTFAQDAKKEGKKNADPAKRAEAMMKQLDKNSDGKISKEEFAAGPQATAMKAKGGEEAVGKRFDSIDKNKDGNLDMDELKAPPAKGKAPKKNA